MIRPKALMGRIISVSKDKWTYLFWPPFHPSKTDFFTIFRALGFAVYVLLVALGQAVLYELKFCRPSHNGHEFGWMVEGDDMCVTQVLVSTHNIYIYYKKCNNPFTILQIEWLAKRLLASRKGQLDGFF